MEFQCGNSTFRLFVVVAISIGVGQAAFGYTITCETEGAKPVFTFDGEMVCGCVKGGSFAGPCMDGSTQVKEMSASEAEQIAKQMTSDTPPYDGKCEVIPEVFLTSGTADTGADFDLLYNAAVNSACNQTELEWRARDCRDALVPPYQELQDRSAPYCPLECETLFLNVSKNCPMVYQLLKLSQFQDICPSLKTVQLAPMPASVSPMTAAPVPTIPVPTPQMPTGPVPTAQIPTVTVPTPQMPTVPVPTPQMPTGPVPDTIPLPAAEPEIAPLPASGPASVPLPATGPATTDVPEVTPAPVQAIPSAPEVAPEVVSPPSSASKVTVTLTLTGIVISMAGMMLA